jgi:arginyl-tRNA synthetase
MILQRLKERISATVAQVHDDLEADEVEGWIEIPPDPSMGDFGIPCFKLAPIFQNDPTEIAGNLVDDVRAPDGIQEVTNEGPYLNFHIDRMGFISRVLPDVLDPGVEFGHPNLGEGEPVVIDYSSPNIAKPFSVGHLRSTAIGAVLYRLYDALGYDPVAVNHLGDWGTQCGKQLLAFEKWGDEEELEEQGVEYLQELYVRINEAIDEDPDLQDQARDWFRRLEEGDEGAVERWKQFRETSIAYLDRIYDRLGVHFDTYTGESFFHDRSEDVIDQVEEAGILTESEGALIVEFAPEDMPPFLLRKEDGSTLYATRDLAAALYRHEEYGADRLLYVVASEQNLHFRQLFRVLEKMGHDWVEGCEHVNFGLVQLEEGKMSTRSGDVVLLEDLLERGIEKTENIIRERQEHLSEGADASVDELDQQAREIAEHIGIGAVLFSDLKDDRERNVTFDWDEAIGYDPNTGSFRGETGPYLQYTHVRLCGIEREFATTEWGEENVCGHWDRLTEPEEFLLVRRISRYPLMLERALDQHKPSVIANYLVDLAQSFNHYYHDREKHKVISEDRELTKARVALCKAVRSVLASGLELLGIEPVERM